MEAQVVVGHRLAKSRLPRLENMDEDQGYAMQLDVNAALEAHLGPRAGYKIGATTEAMRQLLQVDEPVAGEVFASTVHQSGVRLERHAFVAPGIETEIAVRLEADVLPDHAPYDRDTIGPYVDVLMPSIEIVDDRYEDFRSAGAPTFAADNNFNAGLILGAPIHSWRDLELDRLQAQTFVDGNLVAHAMSSQLMGHPLDALAWLANRYARLGRPLKAGHFVSLGTITPVQWIERDCSIRIEIEELGELEMSWS